ncbi:uncharacterized protein WCC33_002784 [Rhinophrynus dorsalis]
MAIVWFWICLFLQFSWTLPFNFRRNNALILMRNKVERTGEPSNFIKRSRIENRERMEIFLEMLGIGRRSNGQDLLRYHRTQCNYMSQPWLQRPDVFYNMDPSALFLFRVFTGPLRPIFPQHNLFRFISRIYRCCKLGFPCRRVKGLQGTLNAGDGRKAVEFYIDSDILSLSILRAELHLEVSVTDQLTVIPVLTTNGIALSRFTQSRSEHVADLILDVMFLFQILKESETEDMMNEDVTELSLSLHCIQNDRHVPCNLHGVSLIHAPFLALQYE